MSARTGAETELAVLTDPSRGGAGAVRALLRASGLEAAYGFWLCERLGHSAERVQRLAPEAWAALADAAARLTGPPELWALTGLPLIALTTMLRAADVRFFL